MLRASSPVPTHVYPNIKELVVVLTHNENKKFERYAGSKFPLKKTVVYCNDDRELNSAEFAAFEALIALTKDSLSDTRPEMLTFVLDFNFGFSGCNISPIPGLLAHLETEDCLAEIRNILKDDNEKEKIWHFQLTQTEFELKKALAQGQTPLRFILTGSGGQNSVTANNQILTNITSDEAINRFGFEGINCTKYMFQCARTFTNYTPGSTTRRLLEMDRESSSSTNSGHSSSSPPASSRCASNSANSDLTGYESPISTKSTGGLTEMSPIEILSPTLPNLSCSSSRASPRSQEFTSPTNIGSMEDLMRALTLTPRQQDVSPERKAASSIADNKSESPRLSPLQRPKAITISPNSKLRAKCALELELAQEPMSPIKSTLRR